MSKLKLTKFVQKIKTSWKRFKWSSGVFCKVMDIFVSGYRKLDIDSELLFVRLVFEEKIKFWKKIFYSTDSKTSYEVQSEVIEQH